MNYRILSLDGGGTWALIQIKALIALYGESVSGHAILRDFNMVAANSGGSIVLGGLVEDLTLAQMLNFFLDSNRRKSAYSPTHSFGDKFLHDILGLGPKYSAENKLAALENTFPDKGTRPLAGITAGLRRPGANEDVHLLIVAFDYDRNRAAFFRSSSASGSSWGSGETLDVTLAEAIHASTNAPVNYFDAPATFPDHAGRYWDGAITGCNNPVLAGVTEAIAKTMHAVELAVLSLGTGSVALPWPQPGENASPYLRQVTNHGFVTDLRRIATSILDDPPDIATYLAHVMTGSGLGLQRPPADSRIVRMSPLVSPVGGPGKWRAPAAMSAAQFTYLTKLGIDAIEQEQVDAIAKYADTWIKGDAPNQPLRMNGDTLVAELGQTTFRDARAAWNAIM